MAKSAILLELGNVRLANVNASRDSPALDVARALPVTLAKTANLWLNAASKNWPEWQTSKNEFDEMHSQDLSTQH